ncbi:hypothetical protein F511_04629 [Dorcoceras hygrometricum]|uniref:Uncharacterized protein n=1 Tax=Dorcoceras hygrometricum TaxID=472368 RepID=A0A2Z7BYE3_9LAMI|nr:hypothetical protein F511_04629 [Dorcoceras hygrometricum]
MQRRKNQTGNCINYQTQQQNDINQTLSIQRDCCWTSLPPLATSDFSFSSDWLMYCTTSGAKSGTEKSFASVVWYNFFSSQRLAHFIHCVCTIAASGSPVRLEFLVLQHNVWFNSLSTLV